MNQIVELRKKRAELWNSAKIYLDQHRGADGMLDKIDQEVYDKMEADVVRLGKEIERLERQAHIHQCISEPLFDPPVLEERHDPKPIAGFIQETRKILCELDATMSDLESVLKNNGTCEGAPPAENPCCLQNEAKITSELAMKCLNRFKHIKEIII